jgi:KDO2-lipid IV(A) lauroyltransferase
VALKNLALIFPNKSVYERRKIAREMWEHLGRNFAELAFLKGDKLTARITDISGLEHTQAPQTIYVSGHFGQWELLNSVVYDRGIPITSVYRHLNNLILDERLKSLRLQHTTHLIRKKGDSAIALVRVLNQGMNLSLLIDQRLTNGMVLPFLGQPARSNTAAARLALKMNLPIVPAFITRTKGAYFKAEILPPLSVDMGGSEEEKVANLTRAFNALLEARIHSHPEQYLWLHDRWK